MPGDVSELIQIGEVAARTGLSLRSIRYYEEVGLIRPADRSPGGFRLYAEAEVDRLELIKRMKPLGFPLEDMKDLLAIVDALDAGASARERSSLLTRLEEFQRAATQRVAALTKELSIATEFAAGITANIESQRTSDSTR